MRLTATVALLGLALIPTMGVAGIVTVDCTGGADFTDLHLAILSAGVNDTVLVAPCTYFADPDPPPPWTPRWPVELHDESPVIISTGGAEVTIIEGDGTISAFVVADEATHARVHIEGFTIRNVVRAVALGYDGGSNLMLRGNIIENTTYGISTWFDHGEVSGNIFRHIPSGALVPQYFSGLIENNEIYDCALGIGWVANCDHLPVVRGNHIHDNVGVGIQAGFVAHIEDNIIENNGHGITADISLLSCESLIQGNTIRGNQWGITLYYYGCRIAFNDIYSNSEADVRIHEAYYYPEIIDASQNWWGTTDPVLIAEHILDCYDSPEVGGCVEFEPCCISPGCEASPVRELSWGSIKAIYR